MVQPANLGLGSPGATQHGAAVAPSPRVAVPGDPPNESAEEGPSRALAGAESPTLGPDGSSDYRALLRQVRAAGLMKHRTGYYGVKMGLTLAAFIGGWALVPVLANSWAVLLVAAFLAVVSAQVAFVGHDAGHQQIFRSRLANRAVGFAAGNALNGLSFGWWVPKHNAHHAHPNQVGRDPDITSKVIAFTPELAERRRGLSRRLVRRQAWLFFPLLGFEGLALHAAGLRMLIRRRDATAAFEAFLLAAHVAAYFGVLFWLLSPLRACAFVVVQQVLFGLYLGGSFSPNHKGTTLLEHDAAGSFVGRQVVTSRNVSGGPFTTFLLGGLNYQIEHHLFPAMPRPNLRRCQPIVRDFCIAHNLPYQQCGLFRSYGHVLAYLSAVGAGTQPVRTGRIPTGARPSGDPNRS